MPAVQGRAEPAKHRDESAPGGRPAPVPPYGANHECDTVSNDGEGVRVLRRETLSYSLRTPGGGQSA